MTRRKDEERLIGYKKKERGPSFPTNPIQHVYTPPLSLSLNSATRAFGTLEVPTISHVNHPILATLRHRSVRRWH